jgi:uncharacterized protein DUF4440
MTKTAATLLLIPRLLALPLAVNASSSTSNSCTSSLLNSQAVVAANARFEAAMLSSHTGEMAHLLHADFLYVTAAGEIRDRQELLRSYGAREVHLVKFHSEGLHIRIYGSVAILNADVTKEGDYSAGPRKGSVFTGHYRFTRVYVCGDQGWQLVSTHESRIAE